MLQQWSVGNERGQSLSHNSIFKETVLLEPSVEEIELYRSWTVAFGRRDKVRVLDTKWGCSSVGRAVALQAIGQEFESPQLHHTESVIFAGEARAGL